MELLMRRLIRSLAGPAVGLRVSGSEAGISRAIWEKRIVHAPAMAPVLSGDTLWVVGTERGSTPWRPRPASGTGGRTSRARR